MPEFLNEMGEKLEKTVDMEKVCASVCLHAACVERLQPAPGGRDGGAFGSGAGGGFRPV